MFASDLESRRNKIFEAIVTGYINMCIPIGSQTVRRLSRLSLSPASIRNVMKSLEEAGLITHPHTSAGRVPTDTGYRYYVDAIMQPEEIARQIQEDILCNCRFDSMGLEDFIENISKVVSELTNHMTIILMPQFTSSFLRELQLLPAADSRVLAIVLTMAGLVRTRLFKYADADTEDTKRLAKISAFINEHCRAERINRIKNVLEEKLSLLSDSSYELCKEALEILKMIDFSAQEDRVFIDGMHHLMEKPEFNDSERFKSLFETLEHRQELLDWLQTKLGLEDTILYIGRENPCKRMGDCTIVMSPYKLNDKLSGIIAVLGPTRMPYSTVVPTVEYVSEFVNNFYGRP